MYFLVNSPARPAGRERGSRMPASSHVPRTHITGTPGARPALGRRRVLLLLLGVFVGCRRKKKISLPPPKPARVGESEVGIASWYGRPYHGRRTSNGEVYDMNKMTAAHLRLPFNTWVRVRNLRNRRTVDVRITDRGPFIKGRIIDLSRAAAKQIRMIGPGTVKVRVKVIATPKMRYKPEKQRSVEEPVAIEQPIEPQEPDPRIPKLLKRNANLAPRSLLTASRSVRFVFRKTPSECLARCSMKTCRRGSFAGKTSRACCTPSLSVKKISNPPRNSYGEVWKTKA